MEGLIHIVSPFSAPWCAWTMMVLLLCAILAEVRQRGIILQAGMSLLASSDRVYKDAPLDISAQVLLTLFRIGTLALAIYVCFYVGQPFSMVNFWIICGLILGVVVVKMICHLVIDYTFQFSRQFNTAWEHYSNIATIATVVLYPLLLGVLRWGSATAGQWIVGAVGVLFLLLWIYRGGRMLVHSPLAILYFALYIVTLEVLPMGALLYLSGKLIHVL